MCMRIGVKSPTVAVTDDAVTRAYAIVRRAGLGRDANW